MSFADLADRLAQVGNRIITIRDELPPTVAVINDHFLRLKAHAEGAAATVSSSAQQIKKDAADATQIVTQLFTDAKVNLEDYVTHQRDKIAEIEGTLFGGYLDKYAKIYQQILDNPDMNAFDRGGLQQALIGIKKIITFYTGKAGAEFNFEQFEGDLEEKRRASHAIPKNAGKPLTSKTTGAAGSPAPGGCATGTGSGSLTLQHWQGGTP